MKLKDKLKLPAQSLLGANDLKTPNRSLYLSFCVMNQVIMLEPDVEQILCDLKCDSS